jgi:hypothetical protein
MASNARSNATKRVAPRARARMTPAGSTPIAGGRSEGRGKGPTVGQSCLVVRDTGQRTSNAA